MKVLFGMGMGMGPIIKRDDLANFQELVSMADGYGVHALGTFDSAFIGGDTYVRTTLMATASERALIGPRPTNPLTREPQIMASYLGSIDGLTNGRAFMDIASGDSAVYNMGFKMATRARIEEYITCVRDLMSKGEGTYQGRIQKMRWTAQMVRNKVPISICAEGPKMLHLAGRVGDGVIAGTGLLPEIIKDTTERVYAGAREEGRDTSDVEVWFTTRSSLHDDHDKAIENVMASVSSILHHSMKVSLEDKHVPDELRDQIQAYVDGYVLYEHVQSGGSNPKNMQAMGLADYAIKRFALAGNAKDWIGRIEEIADAGATKLWMNLGGSNPEEAKHYMKVFGEEIMPHFQ